ncbi:MAG TPA: helix-turn-helix transcriptional regulator [Ktedonobacteraceae bacterium]|jgi:transcriptional regulator with XRE-family HTH domain|nr:helix-turn-helix transcriptional regulator [Ktedonobacteraceae bacterium]
MVSQQEQQRRQELGDFLRTRRARISPEQVGLPPGNRRRTPGLRRTEVAQLAGVSIDWYTWLEQGRPISVSIQVLESLAQSLHLNASEREHLFFLAHQQPPPQKVLWPETVSPMVQHFLDHLDSSPAYATGPSWDVVAWNEAALAVFGDFPQMTMPERNLVWHMFMSPTYRQILVNWEEHARHVLAQFRNSRSHFPEDPRVTALLDDMLAASPEFRDWWSDHEVLRIPEGQKMLKHPQAGYLTFEHLTFQVYDLPDLRVTVYTPAAETETSARVKQLLHERQRLRGVGDPLVF